MWCVSNEWSLISDYFINYNPIRLLVLNSPNKTTYHNLFITRYLIKNHNRNQEQTDSSEVRIPAQLSSIEDLVTAISSSTIFTSTVIEIFNKDPMDDMWRLSTSCIKELIVDSEYGASWE